jgi:hypothetical protein
MKKASIARLEAVASGLGSDPDGRLSRLIRDGIVRPARATPPGALFTDHPPRPYDGASAVAALLGERQKGR